jgi:uracil-DNA glycosylase family 4
MPCTKEAYACGLGATARTVMVRSRGAEKPKVLFIGEAPGRDEDIAGEAFVGASGNLMTRLLVETGFQDDQYRFTNVARCVPWADSGQRVTRPPAEDEAKACLEYLWYEIIDCDPKVIVPLGNTAASYLCGRSGIKQMSGKQYFLKIPQHRGRIFLKWLSQFPQYWADNFSFIRDAKSSEEWVTKHENLMWAIGVGAIPWEDPPNYMVVPTWHPAAVLRGATDAEDAIRATLHIALAQAEDRQLVPSDGYVMLKTLDEIKDYCQLLISKFRAGEIKRFACDLETFTLDPFLEWDRVVDKIKPGILCWGTSYEKGQGALIPYLHPESPFKDDSMALMAIRGMLQEVFDEVPVCNHTIFFDALYSEVTTGVIWRKLDFDPFQAEWWLKTDTVFKDLEGMATRYVGMFAHKQEFLAALEAAVRWEVIPPTGKQKKARRIKIPPHYGLVPLELHRKYCCGDADAALRLSDYLENEIIRQSSDPEQHLGNLACFKENMIEVIYSLIEMRISGTRQDQPVLHAAITDFATKIDAIKQFYKDRGYADMSDALRFGKTDETGVGWFNLNSSEDQEHLLHDILGIPRLYRNEPTPKEKENAAKENREPIGSLCFGKAYLKLYQEWALKCAAETKRQAEMLAQGQLPDWAGDVPSFVLMTEEHAQEIVVCLTHLMDYKRLTKLHGTYLAPLPSMIAKDGNIHWEFNPCNTATGRWSAFVHTIPWRSKAKDATISRWKEIGGLILNADESQIEMRVGASLCDDPNFISVLARGGDIHRDVAAMVYHFDLYLRDPDAASAAVTDAERRQCKTVDFGMFYGRGATAIAIANGISLDQAKEIINVFFQRFPLIKEFMDRMEREAKKYGHVPCPTGWRRMISDYSMQDNTGEVRRLAINTPIQDAASFITQQAMNYYYRAKKHLGVKSKIVNFIHDNVVTDLYPGELPILYPLLKKEMEVRPMKRYPWLKVPLISDNEIGVCWGRQMSLKNKDGIYVLEGKEQYFPEIWEAIQKWPQKSELISFGPKMKDGKPVMKDEYVVHQGFINIPMPHQAAMAA